MKDKRILIVDDDPMDREILVDAVRERSQNIRFDQAGNADEALTGLRLATVLPDLIVLDLNMPKIGGSQLLTMLQSHEQFKLIPVCIYSTSINPLEKEKCLQLGAITFYTKPNSFQESLVIADSLVAFCSKL